MVKANSLLTLLLVLSNTLVLSSEIIYTPHNLIIATDIDDVLLKSNKSLKSIMTAGSLSSYLWHCDWHSAGKGYSAFKRANNERKYIEWMKKKNYKPANFLRKVTMQKKVIPETLNLYKKLNAQGFSFYTATNIGSIFFEDIRTKFSGIFNDNFIKNGMTVDYNVKDPIEKPNLRYFGMLKEKIYADQVKKNINREPYYILFIDDKLENVKAARKAGLLAIQFKNAKQLKNDLKRLYGIM